MRFINSTTAREVDQEAACFGLVSVKGLSRPQKTELLLREVTVADAKSFGLTLAEARRIISRAVSQDRYPIVSYREGKYLWPEQVTDLLASEIITRAEKRAHRGRVILLPQGCIDYIAKHGRAYLSPGEAATEIKVSHHAVRKACERGLIPSYKVKGSGGVYVRYEDVHRLWQDNRPRRRGPRPKTAVPSLRPRGRARRSRSSVRSPDHGDDDAGGGAGHRIPDLGVPPLASCEGGGL